MAEAATVRAAAEPARVPDQRPVQLQPVDRQIGQADQARPAIAEAVDGDRHAPGPEHRQRLDHIAGRAGDAGLAHLHLESRQPRALPGDGQLQMAQRAGLGEFAGGQIDRQAAGPAGPLPLPQPTGDRARHPSAERRDQARILGHGHELGGRSGRPVGRPPAQQRLDDRSPTGGDLDLGLKGQFQVAGSDRAAQLDLQPFGAQPPLGYLGLEQTDLSPPPRLGGIHGVVGGLHQQLQRLPVLGSHGDADRRSDHDLPTAHRQRLAQRPEHLVRQTQGLGSVAARQQDRELIARQPAEKRRHSTRQVGGMFGDGLPQPPGDVHQQHVAMGVAQAVVHRLEPIEVDEQQGGVLAVSQGREARLAFTPHMQAVGKIGDRVVQRQPVGAIHSVTQPFQRSGDRLRLPRRGPRERRPGGRLEVAVARGAHHFGRQRQSGIPVAAAQMQPQPPVHQRDRGGGDGPHAQRGPKAPWAEQQQEDHDQSRQKRAQHSRKLAPTIVHLGVSPSPNTGFSFAPGAGTLAPTR